MARTSDRVIDDSTTLGLTLDKYQEAFSLDVNAFNGVHKDLIIDSYCTAIWTQTQRDRLARFIAAAERQREAQLGYFVGEKLVTDERHDIPVGNNPYMLRWKHLVEVALPVETSIETAVAVTYGADDPCEIVVYTEVDPEEIIIYYPGEEVEITPYSIVQTTPLYGDTYVTIKIPRARLVKPELNDNRDDHLRWSDTDNFLETIDVIRRYRDPSEAAQYIWLKTGCTTDCTMSAQTACTRIMGPKGKRLSTVWAEPASYSGGWTTASFIYSQFPDFIQFSYYSGKDDIINQIYTGRLAHALMPYAPCECTAENMYWRGDKDIIPGMYTAYGSTRAAVDTWMFDSAQRIGGGGKMPRVAMSLTGMYRDR